ncbi:hypothetical protein EON63_10355 [archaeon]|nr:MAG: hypothetical protein EON63_10355 [archaeon]
MSMIIWDGYAFEYLSNMLSYIHAIPNAVRNVTYIYTHTHTQSRSHTRKTTQVRTPPPTPWRTRRMLVGVRAFSMHHVR